jgi:hypothetical protein
VAALLVPLGAAGQAAGLAVQADLEVAAAAAAVAAVMGEARPLLAEVRRCVQLPVCVAVGPAVLFGMYMVLHLICVGGSRSGGGFGGSGRSGSRGGGDGGTTAAGRGVLLCTAACLCSCWSGRFVWHVHGVASHVCWGPQVRRWVRQCRKA